jgi:branched-chain amino acid transport system permease protein
MGLTVDSDAGFYYLVLVLFLMTFAGVWILQRSRMGSVFAGIRENEERMTVLGFPVFSYKLTGFVISGVIGGYAGYLNALLLGFAGPGALFWTTSGEALLMVILGGTTSLAGPVIGAAVFIGISHYAVSYTDHWRLFVGLAFITIVMFAPQGIVSIAKSRFQAWRQLKTPDKSGLTK